MNLKNVFRIDFFQDSFWALLGNVISKGSVLVNSILLAKILTITAFGAFNSLRNTLTTLAIFTTFGLGFTSTKYVADCVAKNRSNLKPVLKKIYSITITFSFTFSLVLFVFAKEVSNFYYNNSDFVQEIRLLSFWVLLLAITTTQEGIISGLGVFKKMSLVNILVGILTLILTPLFAWYYGVVGACVSLLIIQFIYAVFNLILIYKNSYTEADNLDIKVTYKDLLLYSLPLTLINGIYTLSLWINYYLLQNHYSYSEVALYSAAMQWFLLLMFIPVVLRNVILSYFSKQQGVKNNIFKYAITASFASTILPAILIIIFSPLIEKIYGESFKGLAAIVRIMAIIPIFIGVVNVMEQYLFSKSKNWIVFYICFIKDIGTCVLFAFLIFYNKIENAAYYLSISYLILSFVSFLIYMMMYFKTDFFKSKND